MIERPHRVRAADGTALVLTELGESRGAWAVILFHGFAQNRSAYVEGALPAALIEQGARVFAAELRGHGRSKHAGLSLDHGLATYLDQDLPALVDAARAIAGVERIVLVGHSMGGILGYAHLARDHRLSGLVTLGAPVIFGADRPVLRATARVVRPFAARIPTAGLPIDRLLRTLARAATMPPGKGVFELWRLGNPREADVEALLRVLRSAEPASRKVLLELLTIIESGKASIAGIDLEQAVAAANIPLLAVIAGRDIFASRASVEPVQRAGGEIVEWAESAHVDLSMGRRVHELAQKISALYGRP